MKNKLHKLFFSVVAVGLFAMPIQAASIVPTVDNPVAEVPTNSKSAIKNSLKEFKSLSKKERKERVKLAKKELKNFKAEKRNGGEPSTNTLLLVILAILLPPLAVYLHEGVINNKFWISLILTLIFWIPGVIYALVVVLGKD